MAKCLVILIVDLSADSPLLPPWNAANDENITPLQALPHVTYFIVDSDSEDDDNDRSSSKITDMTNDYLPSPPLSPANKKRTAPPMTEDSENEITAKMIKLSTPSKHDHIFEHFLNANDDCDLFHYELSKARRELKKNEQKIVNGNTALRNQLEQFLPTIMKEKARWEMMWKHELKATEQRVRELKDKIEDLKAFDNVLNRSEQTGSGEGEVLAHMEACKPVA